MQCRIYFFYGKNTTWEDITRHLENIPLSYRLITDSEGLNEFLKKKGWNSSILDEVVPDYGQDAHKVYKISKDLQNKYRAIFKDVTLKDVEIFDGFEYSFLRQLTLLTKTRMILEDKKDTIFILQSFFVIFFSIIELAIHLGYESDLKVGFIRGNKIEYIESHGEENVSNYKNKFSLLRALHFLKSTSGNHLSLNRLQSFSLFISRIFSFAIKLLFFKYLTLMNIDPIEVILKKIDKKIKNTSSKFSAESVFFVTASREDLYLKPLYPILNRFRREGKHFQIMTSDLTTSLVLSKNEIPFINLFEEINILTEEIKKSEEGKKIHKTTEQFVTKNISLFGTGQLSTYLLNQACRSAAVTIICDHIIRQMKLKSIVAVADGEMLENLAIDVCRKYKIPSFSILPAAVIPIPIFSDWFHADKICVYGLHGLEILTSLGYDRNRIIVTGHPKYDYFKVIDSKKSRLLLEEIHHLDRKKQLIVVGMARWNKNDENWMSNLIKFCNKNNFEIIIKVHPMYKTVSHEESENIIKKITERCRNLKYVITHDTEIYTLLSAADLVITDYSNVGIEAVLLEKPVLTVNFPKENWDNYTQRVDVYGASIYIDEYLELENIILEIFIKNLHIEKLKIGWKKIFELYNFDNDGKASDRIFNMLIKLN